jgi:hypothetical protein
VPGKEKRGEEDSGEKEVESSVRQAELANWDMCGVTQRLVNEESSHKERKVLGR